MVRSTDTMLNSIPYHVHEAVVIVVVECNHSVSRIYNPEPLPLPIVWEHRGTPWGAVHNVVVVHTEEFAVGVVVPWLFGRSE